MIDGTKPELHWQRASQWGCNWQQVLNDYVYNLTMMMMMTMMMMVMIDDNCNSPQILLDDFGTRKWVRYNK